MRCNWLWGVDVGIVRAKFGWGEIELTTICNQLEMQPRDGKCTLLMPTLNSYPKIPDNCC